MLLLLLYIIISVRREKWRDNTMLFSVQVNQRKVVSSNYIYCKKLNKLSCYSNVNIPPVSWLISPKEDMCFIFVNLSLQPRCPSAKCCSEGNGNWHPNFQWPSNLEIATPVEYRIIHIYQIYNPIVKIYNEYYVSLPKNFFLL